VRDLIGSLLKQAGAYMWWNSVNQIVEFRAIRQPSKAPYLLTDDNTFVSGSIKTKEQTDKRVSQVWVYYGIIDPSKDKDDPNNYRSVYAEQDASAEGTNEYDS